jgi:hypothetical protein
MVLKELLPIIVGVFLAGLLLLVGPASVQTLQGPATTAQPLISEGTLAFRLVPALSIDIAGNGTEAESILGAKGIANKSRATGKEMTCYE